MLKRVIITLLLLLSYNAYRSNYKIDEAERSISSHVVADMIINSFDFNAIDESIERFRINNQLNGLAVAIVKDERLVYARGFGYADVKQKIPTAPDMLFRVASVSKLITAVAVMKLVESKKLRLDSKVFGKDGILNDLKYLQIKDKNLENITVRHLLNHSGGWTQNYGDPAFLPHVIAEQTNDPEPLKIESYIKFLTQRRVHFQPGSISAYSNIGYMVLGEVIAKVANTDYETYVKNNVLNSLKIHDMALGGSFENEKLQNEVCYYQPEDAKPVECFDGSKRMVSNIYGGNDIRLIGSAGGWIASPIDLLKLVVAIDLQPKVKDILSSDSITEMTRVDENGLDPLGWRSTNKNGEWWRTGTLNGSSALIKRDPSGLSWVILSNTSTYRGPMLALEMDRMMTKSLRNFTKWPDFDLFGFYNN